MSSTFDLEISVGLVLDLVILTVFLYRQVKPSLLEGFTLPSIENSEDG
jgi:hypothetical protein